MINFKGGWGQRLYSCSNKQINIIKSRPIRRIGKIPATLPFTKIKLTIKTKEAVTLTIVPSVATFSPVSKWYITSSRIRINKLQLTLLNNLNRWVQRLKSITIQTNSLCKDLLAVEGIHLWAVKPNNNYKSRFSSNSISCNNNNNNRCNNKYCWCKKLDNKQVKLPVACWILSRWNSLWVKLSCHKCINKSLLILQFKWMAFREGHRESLRLTSTGMGV